VSAAAQIQPKVNPLGDRVAQGLAREPLGHPDDAVNADRQECDNQGNLFVEILIHRPVSLVEKIKN
jgi:hypothetical protein